MESVVLLGLMGVGYLMNKDSDNKHKVTDEVTGPLYPEQTSKIAELLEAYKNNCDNRKEGWDKIQSIEWGGRLVKHDTSSSYYVGTLIAKNSTLAKEYREKYCEARLYPPLHEQPYYSECERGDLSNTTKLYKLLVNLPLYEKNIYNS